MRHFTQQGIQVIDDEPEDDEIPSIIGVELPVD
jgi:hypothetical protein